MTQNKGLAAWQATGRDVPDLRDTEEETGFCAMEDEPRPGRVYEPGFMEIIAKGTPVYLTEPGKVPMPCDGWMVTVGNHCEIFESLTEAEQMLWDEYARDFYRGE